MQVLEKLLVWAAGLTLAIVVSLVTAHAVQASLAHAAALVPVIAQ